MMKATGALTEEDVRETSLRLRNWERWGDEDQCGTLNHVSPDHIVAAAGLVRRGSVFSLAMPFDSAGPHSGRRGRHNPIHYMIQSGTDAYSGRQDDDGLRYADDAVIMVLQCGTQWDALSHVFYDDFMYNGYDIRLVDSHGAARCGIEHVRDKMVGRGVLLDIARMLSVDYLEDGFSISAALLEEAAAHQGVDIGRGDFVIIRTGQLERCLAEKNWRTYAGGAAPGLAFDTLEWLQAREVAAVASDTFAVEVRPEATETLKRPWHWVAIPNMGLSVGEIFHVAELAADCAGDGVYEFMLVAPPLPITGAVGSPVNPIAIK
ncbi:MAG: cyclase family protein [bacterium]